MEKWEAWKHSIHYQAETKEKQYKELNKLLFEGGWEPYTVLHEENREVYFLRRKVKFMPTHKLATLHIDPDEVDAIPTKPVKKTIKKSVKKTVKKVAPKRKPIKKAPKKTVKKKSSKASKK